MPVWTLFMLIGTCTWSFFKLTGEKLPAYITKADQVFPYFLTMHLPVGMAGLFMASLIGAAMSGLASDLNCLAVGGGGGFLSRLPARVNGHPAAARGQSDRGLLRAAVHRHRAGVAHSKGGALSMWFSISAIASGGLAGLFLLAYFSSRATRQGVYVGIVASVLFTTWATMTLKGDNRLLDLGGFNYPWHDLTIGAVAHMVLLSVGYVASRFTGRPETLSTTGLR